MSLLITAIEDNTDAFNVLVNNALSSKECCCEDLNIKKLFAVLSFMYEIDRYYSQEDIDTDNFIDKRVNELIDALDNILKSIDVNIISNTTNDVNISYSDVSLLLLALAKKEMKLGKSVCWCDIFKTTVAFQLLNISNSDVYALLSSENKQLIENIYSQSVSVFSPTVRTIHVKHQYLS